MAGAAKIDLIRTYCGGLGERFAGAACDFYIQLTALCRLLEEETLELVFTKGRCKPQYIIDSAIKRNLNKYKDRIDADDLKGYTLSIPFIVFERIKNSRLKTGFNLPTLIGYIRKSVYCEIIQVLMSDGVFVRKQCGNCISLTVNRPYICQNEGIVLDGNKNEYFNKERKRNDKACNFFEKIKVFEDTEKQIGDEKISIFETIQDETTEIEPEDKFCFNDIRKLLKNRISDSKSENHKKIYKRHYAVIVNLYHYLSQGLSIQKAKQIIAEKLHKNAKTIDRDLKEIRQYLPEELLN
jgi:hypothetical protein